MISFSFYCIVPLCPITALTLAAKRPKNFGAVRTTFHNHCRPVAGSWVLLEETTEETTEEA